LIGLSDGFVFMPNVLLGYALSHDFSLCFIDGTKHDIELPNMAIKSKLNGLGDVVGCGLLLDMKNKVSIFFTLNGTLLGYFGI
jgi:hypothetical protein